MNYVETNDLTSLIIILYIQSWKLKSQLLSFGNSLFWFQNL